ncbi:sigma-70 family RNA polymerase sigma factor [Nocardioides marmorisolisilvae]|uniref:Sigma-70 family RNA polymerase sigma factor n=1 Tax=Nocardioides marmorisolisilvae TaxID=1542737 RepID=A0A3N0DU67_9ACTN|nr:sigma-70 family RNA polymerase sigma factor [Nocardioides marmorisolisilvae]RNL79177.1 sigma-70 family RNA polymerase sigma factor [Nocardioides marmorisolisilvae]
MTAPLGLPEASDAELVGLVLQADREAFAVVYDRYGPRLYDFAYSMLRQREDAADAVADSFVTFAEKLPQLREPDRLRPWLYAIVRSECLRRLKQRKRVSYGDDDQLAEIADSAMTPDEAAEQAALQKLVWDAAAGLADRDRALLDLHLRQGLEGSELGEAMGVSASNAYVMLNRLKGQVDKSLGALLVARLGREDCAELDKMLGSWDGSFSPLIRKRVARHIENCEICGERRKRMLSPWALLAGIPLFAAPAALRRRVLDDTQLVAYVEPGSGGAGAQAGGEAVPTVAPRRRGRLAAAGIAAVLLIGGAVYFWPSNDDATKSDDLIAGQPLGGGTPSVPTPTLPTPTLSSIPTPSLVPPTLVPPSATAATATAAAGALKLSTARIDLGRTRSSASFTVTNTGGTALSFLASTGTAAVTVSPASKILDPGASAKVSIVVKRGQLVEGPIDETISVTSGSLAAYVKLTGDNEIPPSVSAPRIGADSCNGSNRFYAVTVKASDVSAGVTSVKLIWSGAVSGSTQLTSSPTTWHGSLGPVTAIGTVTVRAVATDGRGNTTTSAPRTFTAGGPCPQ